MKRQFIPNFVLKSINDLPSLKLSNNVRNSRNRLLLLFKKAVKSVLRNRKTYTCENKTDLPGKLLLQETSENSVNNLANIAHEQARKVHDFFLTVLERDSLDGKGKVLISSVNYDVNYNNAFYNGEQMVYGDGDGEVFKPLCLDLSVCAHEFGHGVIDSTAKLYYWFESGALNESYADIFGIAAEHFHTSQINPKEANWLLGDEIIGSKFPGKAIRSFKDEKAYSSDPQPKYMKNYKWTFEDNGGVHINSGIHNRAFMELCLLLKEPSYGKPVKIAYKALLSLGATSGFKASAKAQLKAAEELYGKGSKEAQAVKQAFNTVGIKI